MSGELSFEKFYAVFIQVEILESQLYGHFIERNAQGADF